jgi:hypothetical protein
MRRYDAGYTREKFSAREVHDRQAEDLARERVALWRFA